MRQLMVRTGVVLALLVTLGAPVGAAAAAPGGTLTWGVHITLAARWLDPNDTEAFISPFLVLYAIHDALVKPMPGGDNTPCLAESWTVSKDGLSYEFVLRKGARFHNGEPVTAEDVKFSFDRYKGAGATLLKEKVKDVQVLAPNRVRFVLKEAWPDFMTFYGTSATGAAWIVPKKYVEKVGDDGFKKAPIGAGPYRFVSFTPGVELVFEAFDQYWRKTPAVKRLVFKVIQDESTRLAALKRGEVDIAYSIRGALAQELERTPGLSLKPAVIQAPFWVYFADQWDAKSPWHDPRVRLAVNHAINRKAINQAETLGHSKITWSIIPVNFEYFWQPPAYSFDQAKARQLLTEAGYPNGLDGGDYYCDVSYSNVAEAVANDLQQVGIRVRLTPLERGAFFKGYAEKKFKNLIQGASGAFGNAATRIEAFVASGGIYAYGSYPDIDGLFREQAGELDRARREAALHKIQQLVYDKAMFAPIWQLAFLNGVGPRVGESGLGLIAGHAYSAPYEDVTLKAK
jgi:peptide/nickel transport system substrate-binding protein